MPTQQSLRRAPSRRPWMLAALAALLAAATLTPGAIDAGRPTPSSGKIVPPKNGTWVGTYQEATGPQLVKQSRVLDLEDVLGRKEDVDHIYEGWQAPFPGWRETWDNLNGAIDTILRLLRKYNALLDAGEAPDPVPVYQYNWKAIFRVPWLPDPRSTGRAPPR